MRALLWLIFMVMLFSSFGIVASPTWSIAADYTVVDEAVIADVTSLWTYSAGDLNGFVSGITLADVDLDGKLEVIGGTWGNNRIHVVNGEDGSLLWMVTIGNTIYCTPAVGDVDGDLNPEVVFCADGGKTYALNGEDGTQLWNKSIGSITDNGVCLRDVNNDTCLDAIIGNSGGTVFALNGTNGSIIWSTPLAKGMSGTPAVGDIDEDGSLEVVACTVAAPSYIYALNAENGAIKWNTTEEREFTGYPAIADLDGDGKTEVIATTSYESYTGVREGKVVVVNGINGSSLWKRDVGANPCGSLSIGDVDGDGRLEVVVGTTDGGGTYLKVFDNLGNTKFVLEVIDYRSSSVFTPILTDLDGNNRLDILLVATPTVSTTVLWGIDGRTHSLLFTYFTDRHSRNDGAVGDFDSDSCVEFAIGSYDNGRATIRAYDLGSSGRRIYWQSDGGVSGVRTGCLADIDPDRDGVSSVHEIFVGTNQSNWDTDSDLMSDGYEIANELNNSIDDSNGDADLDGLVNLQEFQIGTYANNRDSDGDDMSDYFEAYWGLNPCYDDAADDPDSDMLSNLGEYIASTNPFNNDTDSDTMPDGYEVLNGTNPLVDDRTNDLDLDGLTNIEEFDLGTKPNDADSEDDGMPDGWEYNNSLNPLSDDAGFDADNDMLTNLLEYLNGCDPQDNDTDSDLIPDGWEVTNGIYPLTDDSLDDPDGDTLTNIQEYGFNTNPLNADSDSDALNDNDEIYTYNTDPILADTDADNMPDGWEVQYSLQPLNSNDASEDPDNDDLTNLQEYNLATNPNLADTDSDGINDKVEIDFGLDPLVSNVGVDSDSDGLEDIAEIVLGTDPTNPDSDSDGLTDGEEVQQGLDPLVPNTQVDSDSDGLDDATEIALGTDPNNSDSDSDGMPDGWEVSRGLDPLEYTDYSGEGIEKIIIASTICVAFAAVGWGSIQKGAPRFSFLNKLKKRQLYIPGIIFLCFALLFAMTDVYGPIDPGLNEETSTSSVMSIDVIDSPYFTSIVRITVWYEMRYYETCYVTLIFTKAGATRTVNLVIESTSYEVKNEYDYGSADLTPGHWQVSISASLLRTINTKLQQTHLDGRNEDQKIWLIGRIAIVATGFILLFIPYRFLRKKQN
jgi:outer membrane protein assembly factor BamB